MRRSLFALSLCLSLSLPAIAAETDDDATTLDTLTVSGRRTNLVGAAISASEGVVGPDEIDERPRLRPGDLLEFVPGLVATQHSGSGKANQYFLRGFNLDHGTDFASFVDDMPANLRSHGHGQGYTDLNFLIPETVQELSYRKGPYHADVGDFSSAGSARFGLADRVPRGVAQLELGRYGHQRALLMDSASAAGGDLLYAVELQRYDGPWTDLDEDVRKRNLLLRYSADVGGGRAHLNAMAYRNRWNSPDQIPQRAVAGGLISRYGQIDPSDGGDSSRYSLSGGWHGPAWGGELEASAYAIAYRMSLWSNFTYFLDDPVNGDQFRQLDDRRIYGFDLAQQWQPGRSRWRIGAQGRYDDIDRVGLFRTRQRRTLSSVRDDRVDEGSLGLYALHEFHFSPDLRSYLGLRHDRYRFEVDSDLTPNSGVRSAGRSSVKASLAYRPGDAVDLYASYGTGFHSNDARGAVLRVDPVSGEPAERVDPLVGSRGAELGARLHLSDRLQSTVALWTLQLDSELLFVGDAGNTEASRPSRRDGIEAGLYWFGSERVSAELELAYTHARFRDRDPAGREVPGAVPWVIGAGVSVGGERHWQFSAHLRHFGATPLIEDGSVESRAATLLNLRLGRQWQRWSLHLDLFNALGSKGRDIEYYFASRLPGEPDEGVDDVHYHAFEPRSPRLTLRYRY